MHCSKIFSLSFKESSNLPKLRRDGANTVMQIVEVKQIFHDMPMRNPELQYNTHPNKALSNRVDESNHRWH